MLNRASESTARALRGFTETEQKALDDPHDGFRKWQENKGHSWLRRKLWADQDMETYIEEQRKAKPEKFRDEMRTTHGIFEDWMRDWQQGKFNMKSNRPAPKP
jgi:hypothetical protein